MGADTAPGWAARIAYAEKFHVEPHRVNPPLLWWFRVSVLEEYRRKRAAREWVDAHKLAEADADTRRLYDELVRESIHRG